MFAPEEVAYLQSQRLGRLATVAPDGQPDVMPVGHALEDGLIYVGGRYNRQTRKVKNIEAGNARIALIVDDLVSTDPWTVRGISIYGTAEFVERAGHVGAGLYLRITPHTSWSWGIVANSPSYFHKVVHNVPVRHG